MKAIRVNDTMVELMIYQPTDKDREDNSLIWVEDIPDTEQREGYSAELHYSLERGFWTQYIEYPMMQEQEQPIPMQSNEEIRTQREIAYRQESDSLYMAWQKYMAIGDEPKAQLSHDQWIDKVKEIDERFPYNNLK